MISIYQRKNNHSNLNMRKFASASVFALLAAYSCSASAQESSDAPPAESAKSDTLSDIVVTASRRAESLSRAPVAVTALPQIELTRQGILDAKSLKTFVPNFDTSSTGFATSVELTIRGISGNGVFEDNDPSVGAFLDGVYLPRTQQLNGALYDLARVEVLRGPQGTLYGKNTIAGSVNFITAPPTQEFGGHFDISYGNYNDIATHATVNVPLTPTLAVRASLQHHRNNGYTYTQKTSDDYDRTDDLGGRISVLWNPSSQFSWQVVGEGYWAYGTPVIAVDYTTLNDGVPLRNRPLGNIGYPSGSGAVLARNRVKALSLRSKMSWSPNDYWTVNWVGGIGSIYYFSNQDTDGKPIFEMNTFEDMDETNEYSEINVSYDRGPLKVIVGSSYFHEKNVDFASIQTPAFAATADPNGTRVWFFVPDTSARSYGAFGQLTYEMADGFRVTGGLRYSHDKKDKWGKQIVFCPLDQVVVPYVLPASCSALDEEGHGKWSDVSWKAGFDWDVSPSTLFYGSISTGYKAGGISDNPPTNEVYNPEKVLNFELGLKSRAFDDMLRFNLAGFYIKYKDLQLAQNNPRGGVSTTNAGKAHLYGAEAELQFKPSSNDTITGFVTYLRAKYDRYENASDGAGLNPPNLDLSGKELPRTPHFTARVQYQHEFNLPNGGTITPLAAFFYKSSYFVRQWNTPLDRVEGYTQTDASLTYVDPNKWSLQAFVKNIENTQRMATVYCLVGHCYGYFNPPRTYGVRFSYDF